MSKKNWPVVREVQYETGGRAYLVDGRIGGEGKRHFFPTRGEADTKAQQLRIERKNSGANALAFPDRLRTEAIECSEKLAPFKKSLRDAVNFYLPHLQAANRTCTIKELVDQLIKARATDGASERYLSDLRSRLGMFAASFEGKKVSEFTAPEINHWLRSLGVASTTRNNFRRVLVTAFNFARGHGYCLENPAAKTAKAKEIESAVGILTVEQTARLLEGAPTGLVPFFAIGAFAGLRRAELERLDWCEVDLQSGLIEVTAKKAKSARRRLVRIQENLALWLTPYAEPRGPVVPLNYDNLLDDARAAAGIKKWPQNALRHSFASYHLAHFNDAAHLALELGHTDANIVFQHYRELVRPTEAARYWQIKPAAGALVTLAG